MSEKEEVESSARRVLGEAIDNDQAFIDRSIKMVTSARQEILILCGTDSSLSLIERCGLLSICRDKASVGVKTRLLLPDTDMPKERGHLPDMPIKTKTLDNSLRSEASFMIVDGKELLVWMSEKKSDDSFRLRDGKALYLDADVVVVSYYHIFESLWHHVDADDEIRKSRNELARMAADSELLFSSLAESNKDLLNANERLAINDQMQREFINIAAHELRTPIQPILIAANIIEREFDHGKEKVEVTRDDVDMIIRNAKRLERLSAEILEVARIDSHSFKLNKELLKLNEIVRNAVKDMTGRIGDRNSSSLQLECHTSKEVYIHADKERINEVLYNLLDNAVKFTRQGIISVNMKVEDNKIAVQISDTGTGIDPEIHQRLFSKFATKSEKGTGLGLYISRKIIEAHGGKIWAENNRDGRGATFTFTLPAS